MLCNSCDNNVIARGYCQKHYTRWKRHGSPEVTLRVRGTSICSLPDCDNKYEAKGYCSKHYERWKKYGNPLVDLKSGNQYLPKPDFYESQENWQSLTPTARQRITKNGDLIDHRLVSSEDRKYRAWMSRLKRRYGISEERYWDIYYSQHGCCTICTRHSVVSGRLYVDHNHNCCPKNSSCGNCFRGLIWHNCNTLLGHCRDDITVLVSAIKYLSQVV